MQNIHGHFYENVHGHIFEVHGEKKNTVEWGAGLILTKPLFIRHPWELKIHKK